MSEDQTLPPWAHDELSKLLGDAEYNTRAAAHKLPPEVYGLIADVHHAFVRTREAVEKDNDHQRVIPRVFLVRAYSSFLASLRLSLGGQLFEAHVVLRAEIEQAWYALHIAQDPNPPSRAEIWLRRDEAPDRCKTEFSVTSVRSTHEAVDPGTARELHRLYERLIDFGAHPNPFGLLLGLTKSEAGKATTYHAPVLCTDTLPMAATLHSVAAVAIGALKVFQRIYPTRFQLVDLDVEIPELVEGLNMVFKSYVPDVDPHAEVTGG